MNNMVTHLKYKDKHKKFNRVIHISDIHIRTGDPEKARYDEYLHVFQNLIDDLNENCKDDCIVVITGDLFHHKGKIEPSGVTLVNHLIYNILKLAPVVIICGNHDYRQDYPEIPDMIESLLHLYKKKFPFYYLNKTGSYTLNNIGFGVVDIRDTMKSYDTFGRNENRIEFPDGNLLKNVDHKIALFHGWVSNKYKDNQQCYPTDWFNGYTHILLGDIHKYSAYKINDVNIGYSGSLIQQNFGEPMLDHGYLDWDLTNKTVQFNKVYNAYGMITVKKYNDEWYVHHSKKEWSKLIDIAEDDFFPENPVIRMKQSEDADIKCELEKFNITPSKIVKTMLEAQEIEDVIVQEKETTHLEELNTQTKWIEYLKYHTSIDYSHYINNPENLKIPEECEELKKYKERNNKIQKALNEYTEKLNNTSKNTCEHVKFINMKWDYLMCYGEDNYIDFTTLDNKIALLNGKNAMGKSAFLDILCLALYGEPTKMRNIITGKKYTNKIIHDNRPSNKKASSVSILLDIKDDTYEIHRVFGTQSGIDKNNTIKVSELTISKVVNSECKQIVCEGSTLVNKWINNNIGSMESVLMSTMICQLDLNNFFHLKQDEQKLILDSALNLENVSLFGNVLKQSLLGHNDIQNQVKSAMDAISEFITNKEYNIEALDNNYNDAKNEYNKHIELKENWLTQISHKNWSNITVNEDVIEKYMKIKDIYDYHFNKEEYDRLEQKSTEMIRIEEQLKMYEDEMMKYKDTEIIDNSEKLLDKWNKKYEKLKLLKPKCGVTKEWVNKTKNEYDEWIKNQNSEWVNLKNKHLYNENLHNELDNLWKNSISKPSFSRVSSNTQYSDDEIKYFTEKYSLLENSKIQKIDTNGYDTWFTKYTKWVNKNKEFTDWTSDKNIIKEINSIENKLETLKEKNEELKNIQKDITDLEKNMDMYKELKFNPKCNECNSNPFNKKKNENEEQYNELKPYYNKLLKYIERLKNTSEKKNYETNLQENKATLEKYKKYCMEKEYYNLENEKWNTIIDNNKKYEEWFEEFSHVKEQYEGYQWNLYDKWKDNYSKTLENKQEWDIFFKTYNDWEDKIKQINDENEQLELLSVWEEEEKIVIDKLNKYKLSIEKTNTQNIYNTIKKQYDDIKIDVDKWHTFKKIKDEYELYSSYYAIHKIKEFEPNIQSSKCKMDKEYNVLIKTKQEFEKQKEYKDTYEKYKDIESILIERYTIIKNLETHFIGDKNTSDGYKEWIYKNKVIPLLNQEMNYFLGSFEEFRFKMIYEKCRFIYLLQDRGNEPTLDKASGYQNFIISLAFRLALTRIGAIGQRLKHLFIDEGFTACDANNIEKIPVLMKNVKDYGRYSSIILMSHLDTVRECSQLTININRNDPFSYIRYGDKYPVIKTIITPEGQKISKK
jgi:DNA repair exonuclease SbcCD ATPase subunit/DNA repair exonuclease SbcCD nuclease subunit